MEKQIYRLILFAFFINLVACSSLELTMPTATIEAPEVPGRTMKARLGISAEAAREVVYTPDASLRPLNLDDPRFDGQTHTLQPRVGFGAGKSFEWGVQAGVDTGGSSIDTNFALTGKYQFVGSSQMEAQEGDFIASLFGKVGHTENDEAGDQNGSLGAGGFPWNGRARANYVMLGLSAGYRIKEQFLVFGGASFQHINSKVTVNQDPSSDNSDQGGNFSRDRNGQSVAYGLGTRIGIGRGLFNINLKLMNVRFQLVGVGKQDDLTAAGGFSFFF